MDARALCLGVLGGCGDRHQILAQRCALGQRRSVRDSRRSWGGCIRGARRSKATHRLAPRYARLLRTLVHCHWRVAHAVGIRDGQDGLVAKAVLFAADRSSPRLCNRVAAAAHLHRLLAEALGVWASAWARPCGYVGGVALGWSKPFAYWGMPILKLIGPVPVTAWIPVTFYFFPTTFDASVFIVALASGIPVMILTSSGVASVNRAYYDVGRNLGAKPWYLVSRIAIPSALPHTFVGLFMGLYYSFAVLVVAEILGAKWGLGWYISFQTNYSGYANVYATLVIMSLLCAGLVKLLFSVRDRLLVWQKGFI